MEQVIDHKLIKTKAIAKIRKLVHEKHIISLKILIYYD